MDRIEMRPRDLVLPRHDLLEPLRLNEPERRGELAEPEVQAVHLVVGLAVVAERLGELHEPGVARDERAALARRDRLRGIEGVHAGIPVGAWLAPVPARAVGMGAVLE